MSKPSVSRALPPSKPTGPETFEVSKGAGIWPELRRLPKSHTEDLAVMLRRRGRTLDEFYVSVAPSRMDLVCIERGGIIQGSDVTDVIVRSRKTGIARAYATGGLEVNSVPFTGWVNQFAEDLDNKLFE